MREAIAVGFWLAVGETPTGLGLSLEALEKSSGAVTCRNSEDSGIGNREWGMGE
jgi:hypothetical protein